MTAQSQLETYLGDFRRRLGAVIVARGAAFFTAAALAITLVAVYLGIRRAFDPTIVVGARTLLLLALAAIATLLVALPLRGLKKSRGIRDIEQRAPDFDGRLETYDGLMRAERPTPFLGLLAEDALEFARKIPVALKVPRRQIAVPAVVAALAAGSLLWFASFGPDNWRYGVRHLWAGWLFEDTLPPQRLAVTPGDGTVRRGGDLKVAAKAEGFEPSSMQVFALFSEGGQWESAPMARAGESFEFTFFAVREPLRYYVAAAGLRSPEYNVAVVDLPRVTGIKLTYNYPNWTKLEPLVENPGYDIRAVEGTQVTVEVTTDQPLAAAELVANGQRVAMTGAGAVSTGTFEVSEDGEYFVSTLFNDDSVKVTDDYLISVVADNKPVVKVIKPGRDWRASNIEEVGVRIEATDDFGVDKLELRYSVNGGEWVSAPLDPAGSYTLAEQVLFLEEMDQPVVERRARPRLRSGLPGIDDEIRVVRPRPAEPTREPAADEAPAATATAPPPRRKLAPGDVISYYAVAEDRGRAVQTDLFFIEVQPFDRSFSQSTQGGGGGGGGGGQQQDEISRRQKEILVATWNLIKERSEETSSYLDEQQLHDNAQMLAELQRTLAEQARTLASRTRARQLTGVDERIQTFVEALESAAESMDPASERLAEVELDNAVAPEQEALQHLLRAESVFTDIQVAFQQGGGGGGGLAGRDLSELFELEMDLEKNQYETESPVTAMDSPESQVDEAIAKLQELARRQEQLADRANRRNGLTEQERWQQESLRRETEELKRQLEEMQQRLAEAQQQQQQGEQQQGQQGQQGGQPQQGQGGQPQLANNQSGQGQSSQTQQAIQQLNDALEAMNQAGTQGEQNLDPESARRAVEQARRQLQQALEQLTAQRQTQVNEAFSNLSERSEQLYEGQRQLAEELQSALRESANNPDPAARGRRGGLTDEQAQRFAEQKSDLQAELEALERDIERIAQQFRDQTPGAVEELREALAGLQSTQASARLGYGAEGIRRGAASQVAATDSVTTSALRDLERNTEEALTRANQEAVGGEQREADPNAELVAELQNLRRQLSEISQQGQQQARNGGQQPGQQPAPGQGQQQAEQQQQGQQGQQGAGQQGGQQAGGQQAQAGDAAGGAFGGPNNGFGAGGPGSFYDPLRGGVWDPRNLPNWGDPQSIQQAREQLQDASRELLTLGTRLRDQGLTDEQLRAVRELGERLRGGITGNPQLIEQEFKALVNLTEQLELKLASEGSNAERASVRAEPASRFAEGYEDAVAEYFRRLSQAQ